MVYIVSLTSLSLERIRMNKFTQGMSVVTIGATITLVNSPWWASFALVSLALVLPFLAELRRCKRDERIAKYKYAARTRANKFNKLE